MSDAVLRHFDAVVVWKLDRWGRSLLNCIKGVQELSTLGIRFLVVTQNIDTDENNPMSRFLLHIFAAFGELERETIRERVFCGLRTAKAKGKPLGRPKRVFRRDEALQLRAEGKSWRHIAKALNIPLSTLVDGCSEKPLEAVTVSYSKQAAQA